MGLVLGWYGKVLFKPSRHFVDHRFTILIAFETVTSILEDQQFVLHLFPLTGEIGPAFSSAKSNAGKCR